MDVDKDTKQLIEERVKNLKSGWAKNHLKIDMLYPIRKKEEDKATIKKEVEHCEKVLTEIEGMVKDLKKSVNHITDQTLICACYLILGKLINTYKAIFVLARLGHNQEVMELVRSASENNDLAVLFCLDEKQTYLPRWFNGDIIQHGSYRELMDSIFVKSDIPPSIKGRVDHKKLTNTIYRVMSKYTHCSYAALLDSIDVFREDFDFDSYAGFHYVNESWHMLSSALGNTIVVLKAVYSVLRDDVGYEKADQLLLQFAGERTEQDLRDLLDRIT